MTPTDISTNKAIQALQQRLVRGEITELVYEQELRKLLNPLQHRPHPGRATNPPTREHLRFAESSVAMPQTSGRQPLVSPSYREEGSLPSTNETSLSFDDLPTEGLQEAHASHPPARPESKAPPPNMQVLDVFDPKTWAANHLLDARYHIEAVLSASAESTAFLALDLLLQERVTIHLASPALAKAPPHRKRFIRHFVQMRTFAHPQVARMYHIHFAPEESLLYAILEALPGRTLEQELMAGKRQLSAATGESLLFQLATVLAHHNQQTGRHLAPSTHDILWDLEDPEATMVLLHLRHPGPEQLAAPEYEGYCAAKIMFRALAGAAPLGETLTQRNPTIPFSLAEVLLRATSKSPQDWYADATHLYEEYKAALIPSTSSLMITSAALTSSPPEVYEEPPPSLSAVSTTPLPNRKATIGTSQNFQAHFGDLQAIATDARGETLITAGKDRQLKWWDTANWDLVEAETLEKSALTCASLSRCGKWMAYTKSSHRVAVRMQGMSSEVCVLQHKGPVASLLWQEDASRLLVATKDGGLSQWVLPQGNLELPPPPRTMPLLHIEQDNAAGLIATLHKGGLLKLWSLDSHQWLFDLPDAVSPAGCHSFVPPGPAATQDTLLATGHKDGKVRLWNYETGVLERKLQAHSAPIQLLKFSADGQWMVSSDQEGEVRIWNRGDGLQHFTELHNPTGKPLVSCLFVQDQTQLAAMVQGAQLLIWPIN